MVWKNNSIDWFEEFYQRNYKLVYSICFTYMKNKADSEDCTEDVFVKVITKDMTFTDETHEKKWLTITAINLCKDRLKHWWKKKIDYLEDDTLVEDSNSKLIDETLQVVLDLPTKYKDVIYLYYYMGYKTNEIASLLKKPASTVRNQLTRARKLLSEKLGDIKDE